MSVVDKIIGYQDLTKEEYIELLSLSEDETVRRLLAKRAVQLRQKYYRDKIFTRGLIEFTNYCKNNCYYCGIRCGNEYTKRYRLTEDEILECCKYGHELGFRTFVLQGGEDPYFTEERVAQLVSKIKANHPDSAVTLSVGEKPYDTYKRWKEAGADRYLLRHETANDAHYQVLHPENMKLSVRKQCLYDLKALGYQVGAGFMVGSPEQTLETLAEDLMFLKELQPEMVGIGPFIPHHNTIFAKEKAGSVDTTLYLLSIIRILLPKVLLPATTALGTMDENGREKGILHGANVIMPNLSPLKNRKQYDLYDNKISMDEEAAEGKHLLAKRVEKVGCYLADERGDAAK